MIFFIWTSSTKPLEGLEFDGITAHLKADYTGNNLFISKAECGQPIDVTELVNNDIILIINDALEHKISKQIQELLSSTGSKPQTINLKDTGDGEAKELILKEVTKTLIKKLAFTKELLKDTLKSEASLRKEYSSLRESFAVVEDFVKSSPPSLFESNFYFPPTAEQTSITLKSGSSLTQRLPCNSSGFTSISIHIKDHESINFGTLECQITTEEDELIYATWLIDIKKNCLKSYTLALEESMGPEEKTLQFKVSWIGGCDMCLRSSYKYPNNSYLPKILGVAQDRILALEAKKILPGLKAPIDIDALLPGDQNNEPNTKSRWKKAPSRYLKNFSIISKEHTHKGIEFNKTTGKLLVHVSAGGEETVVLLNKKIRQKNAKQIRCKIQTLHKLASPISYQLVARNSSDNDASDATKESDWFEIDPMVESEISIDLSDKAWNSLNILLKTKLSSPDKQTVAFGWSNFYDIELYS